jgi:heptosyltransferase-3
VDKKPRKLLREIQHQLDFFKNLRRYRFDWAIELRGSDRGAIMAFLSGAPVRIGRYLNDKGAWRNHLYTHQVSPSPQKELYEYAAEHCLNILAPFGLETIHRKPILEVPPSIQSRIDTIFKNEMIPADRPIIAIHAFSLWPFKEWQMPQWAKLIDYMNSRYPVTIILTGAMEERPRVEELCSLCRIRPYNLAGKTSIGEMSGLLQRCRLFIGVDTGALHIAAAVDTPTIGIFGPSPAVMWAPRGNQHSVITKKIPCVPCRDKGCQNTEHSLCLDTLTFEECREVVDSKMLCL